MSEYALMFFSSAIAVAFYNLTSDTATSFAPSIWDSPNKSEWRFEILTHPTIANFNISDFSKKFFQNV